MIAGGLEARLTCVDPRAARAFAGRAFDAALLETCRRTWTPAARRGEFHTFAHAGPMFAHPIPSRRARS